MSVGGKDLSNFNKQQWKHISTEYLFAKRPNVLTIPMLIVCYEPSFSYFEKSWSTFTRSTYTHNTCFAQNIGIVTAYSGLFQIQSPIVCLNNIVV